MADCIYLLGSTGVVLGCIPAFTSAIGEAKVEQPALPIYATLLHWSVACRYSRLDDNRDLVFNDISPLAGDFDGATSLVEL